MPAYATLVRRDAASDRSLFARPMQKRFSIVTSSEFLFDPLFIGWYFGSSDHGFGIQSSSRFQCASWIQQTFLNTSRTASRCSLTRNATLSRAAFFHPNGHACCRCALGFYGEDRLQPSKSGALDSMHKKRIAAVAYVSRSAHNSATLMYSSGTPALCGVNPQTTDGISAENSWGILT